MSKNEIVTELYQSREFNECIGKMEPEHLRDDLRSEVVLILLETPEQKLLSIHAAGALKYYTVRIILNLIQSKTSGFYKQYRQQLSELINDRIAYEETDIEERASREEVEDKALSEIDNLYWYNAGIVRLYLKLGTYRAIKDETGIPFPSVYKTVQKSFKEIREKILR